MTTLRFRLLLQFACAMLCLAMLPPAKARISFVHLGQKRRPRVLKTFVQLLVNKGWATWTGTNEASMRRDLYLVSSQTGVLCKYQVFARVSHEKVYTFFEPRLGYRLDCTRWNWIGGPVPATDALVDRDLINLLQPA